MCFKTDSAQNFAQSFVSHLIDVGKDVCPSITKDPKKAALMIREHLTPLAEHEVASEMDEILETICLHPRRP